MKELDPKEESQNRYHHREFFRNPLTWIFLATIGIFIAVVLHVLLAKDKDLTTIKWLGKSLWDWMELVLVPLLLAVGAIVIKQVLEDRDKKHREQEKEIEDKRREQEKEIENKRREQEKKIEDKRRGQEALKDYLAQITELLISQDWPSLEQDENPKLERESGEKTHQVTAIARALTLAVLRELDRLQKGSLISFLIDSKAVEHISLSRAHLREAVLDK